ncbi:MAG: hypothetical protein MHM6MM_003149, partial [Cercozoa sp. M6MM]
MHTVALRRIAQSTLAQSRLRTVRLFASNSRADTNDGADDSVSGVVDMPTVSLVDDIVEGHKETAEERGEGVDPAIDLDDGDSDVRTPDLVDVSASDVAEEHNHDGLLLDHGDSQQRVSQFEDLKTEKIEELKKTRENEVKVAAAMRSFRKLGVPAPLCQSLALDMDILSPTPIQSASLPRLIRGGANAILCEQTGQGKTLAAVLPMLTRLKREELRGVRLRGGRPRGLVLSPTRELAQQTYRVVKQLCHNARLSSMVLLSSDEKRRQQRDRLRAGVDIVVATPGRLRHWMREYECDLTDVVYCVIDEADTMFDQSFAKEMREMLQSPLTRCVAPGLLRRRMNGQHDDGSYLDRRVTATGDVVQVQPAQVVMLSATLTPANLRVLKRQLPDAGAVAVIKSEGHLLPPSGVVQRFVRMDGQDKRERLLETLEELGDKKILIFCNTTASARSAMYDVESVGYDAVCFHGELPRAMRAANWALFSAHRDASQEDSVRIAVATDAACRGLDVDDIDVVINLDFPNDAVEYVHRVGRTARGPGASGLAISLLEKRDVPHAMAIRDAVRHGRSLDSLEFVGHGGWLHERRRNASDEHTERTTVKRKLSKRQRRKLGGANDGQVKLKKWFYAEDGLSRQPRWITSKTKQAAVDAKLGKKKVVVEEDLYASLAQKNRFRKKQGGRSAQYQFTAPVARAAV